MWHKLCLQRFSWMFLRNFVLNFNIFQNFVISTLCWNRSFVYEYFSSSRWVFAIFSGSFCLFFFFFFQIFVFYFRGLSRLVGSSIVIVVVVVVIWTFNRFVLRCQFSLLLFVYLYFFCQIFHCLSATSCGSLMCLIFIKTIKQKKKIILFCLVIIGNILPSWPYRKCHALEFNFINIFLFNSSWV